MHLYAVWGTDEAPDPSPSSKARQPLFLFAPCLGGVSCGFLATTMPPSLSQHQSGSAWSPPASSVNLVDLGFMDARSKLIDLAAFLDRVQRAGRDSDFRVAALREALALLSADEPTRAKQVLLCLSDPSTAPIPKATTQGAIGAYPGQSS